MANVLKNFTYSTVATAPSPATSGTSLTVASGMGALFATGTNATVWPTGANPLSTNAELVLVTAIVGDVLTITRAQEGTSARTIVVGDQIAQTVTKLTLDDIYTAIAAAGDVVGPASATDAVPVLFDGTTGKLVKNSTPTGTGNPVLQTSPTLTTPNLGTPSALVGTNITGTAAGLTAGTASAVAVGGITGLGTGVATALAVNVGSAGAPVVLNGVGGTPSSMTGTNITGTAAGLTAGTASAVAVGGITGLGTGVATALAVNVGSAGAPVVNGGALGTPSSGTLTNATGLPTAGIVDAAVTLAKMANLAQDQFIGRTTASTGVPETATITSAARTVLDDTSVSAMVDTLGGATSTGTGGIARATSPTFVTPILGTPTSGTLTNCTGLPPAGLTTAAKTGIITFCKGDGSTSLSTGIVSYIPRVPFACTITGWAVSAQGSSPTATLDVYRAASGGTALATSSIVGAGTKPALSTGNVTAQTSPASWTSTALAVNDTLGCNLDAVSNATSLCLQLFYTRD